MDRIVTQIRAPMKMSARMCSTATETLEELILFRPRRSYPTLVQGKAQMNLGAGQAEAVADPAADGLVAEVRRASRDVHA